MAALTAKLSKRTVEAVEIPAAGQVWVWDSELTGFFLRVYASGRKVYAVKSRVGRRQVVHTLGVHGEAFTCEQARRAAAEALHEARQGADPSAARKAAKAALTVAELIDRYLTDGPATKPAKRASTWKIDASNLNRHIRPLLGRKVADQVTRAEAARAIRDIEEGKTARDERTRARGRARVTGGAGTARRTRITAAAMFAWGAEHELIASNPFKAVKLAKAPVREQFLSREAAGRFLEALAQLEAARAVPKAAGDALRLLLLTGARKSEILGLTWGEVDFERSRLVLPPERTKAGGHTGERRIVLSPPALAILSRRKAEADKAETPSPYVLPARRGEGPLVGLRRYFCKVRDLAGLGDLRIHDLRHTFASLAIADGASLYLISKLLGHASARTTERYAHLSGDPLEDAAAMVGRRVMGALEGDVRGALNVAVLPSKDRRASAQTALKDV